MNKHFDELEKKMFAEIDVAHDKIQSEYKQIDKRVNVVVEELKQQRRTLVHIKEHASDIQIFLATRQINAITEEKLKILRETIKTARDYDIEITINPAIEALMKDVTKFGNVTVTEKATSIKWNDPKVGQAQMKVVTPDTYIHNIQLRPKKKFEIAGGSKD